MIEENLKWNDRWILINTYIPYTTLKLIRYNVPIRIFHFYKILFTTNYFFRNKNDVILNAHVNTIETTLQIGKLEDDYDIATDTDVTTCADIHSVSLNKVIQSVLHISRINR